MFQLPDSWVWDFWIVKNQDNYHLFFLYASRALHDPERRHHRAGIGHAVSTDLTHWERVTDALVHDDPPSFDHTATWTGSIVQGEDQRWYLFYTGAALTEHGQLRQQIGLATSDDLFHWRKHDSNPLVRADPRWADAAPGSLAADHVMAVVVNAAREELAVQATHRLITETGFACKAELLAKIASLGTRIEEVPVDLAGSRRIGESKMSILPTLCGYARLMARRRTEREGVAA